MHTNQTEQRPVLVLGGNGKTGSRVAARLRERGVPVRIGSRTGEPPFDWEDRSTWAPALAAGARRIVLLSGRGEWTILRCSWFMQNFSEGFMHEQVLAGEVALPPGDAPVPFVDVDDIADAAVAAFTEPGHGGRVYDLSGPRALTFAQAVGEIARATGRDVRYVPITAGEFAAAATAAGVEPEVVEFLRYLFEEVVVEANAGVTDGVRQALGRAPRDFSGYARATAASGAWTPAAAVR
jgi:uncharacterized protein YbjT (DUF2867 family)